MKPITIELTKAEIEHILTLISICPEYLHLKRSERIKSKLRIAQHLNKGK